MISYEITLEGAIPIEVRIEISSRGVPTLDVYGFGEHRRDAARSDQHVKLRAKLIDGLAAAGVPLPGRCVVTGPGHEVFAAGLPLALLAEIVNILRSKQDLLGGLGLDALTHSTFAWGDIVDGEAVPAAGELAVALALAKRYPPPNCVEILVPRDKARTREVLGNVPNLRVRSFHPRELTAISDHKARAPIYEFPPEIPEIPQVLVEPPDLVKLAIEVGIAGRMTTALVGSQAALGDWQAWAQLVTPEIPLSAALARAAVLDLWPEHTLGGFRNPSPVRVSPGVTHDELTGQIDLTRTDARAGLLVHAHHGLLLVEQADRVSSAVLGRIQGRALRLYGYEHRSEHTLITSMRKCLCDPPPNSQCYCKLHRAGETAGLRKHVTSQLRVDVWADGQRRESIARDFSPTAVRERIALAWEIQDRRVMRQSEVREVLGNLDGTTSGQDSERAEHQRLAEILRTRPW